MSDNDPSKVLEDLDARLQKAKGAPKTVIRPLFYDPMANGAFQIAMRIAIEMLAAVGVGIVLGLALDHWLGIAPWGLVVLTLVGAVAGLMNVVRMAKGAEYTLGYDRKTTDISAESAPETKEKQE